MTKNITIFSALFASLIYIGAVIGLIWLALNFMGQGISALPQEWTGLFVVLLFTLVFCSFLISSAIKNNHEKRNLNILDDRLGVYKRFLDAWLGDGLIYSTDPAPFQLNYAMGLLASDRVLKLSKKLIRMQETDPDNVQLKHQLMQQIILEMRRDLGQPNFAILPGDLDFIFKEHTPKSKKYTHEIEKTYQTT